MKAKDFIDQTRIELQEKSIHWSEPELLIKLQRSYTSLQFDLPFFMATKTLDIKKGICEYNLDDVVLKNIAFSINAQPYNFVDFESFFVRADEKQYSFNDKVLMINQTPKLDTTATLAYRYLKQLENINCNIELPLIYHEALRYLFMSKIHEKPTRNTKDRNLNKHYLALYQQELRELKTTKKQIRRKKITSNYQKV